MTKLEELAKEKEVLDSILNAEKNPDLIFNRYDGQYVRFIVKGIHLEDYQNSSSENAERNACISEILNLFLEQYIELEYSKRFDNNSKLNLKFGFKEELKKKKKNI